MKQCFVFGILSIFLFSGCIQRVDDVSDVVITPSVLDFGRVRATDSPLSLAFELENSSEEPLKILDITSGCGCTVIDIPQEPILPKEKKTLDIKINLYGRSGEFTNKVFVQTTNRDLFIDIRGTIVTDIWFNGLSIRCTADSGETDAKAIFTLLTQDYPDIQFDWSDLPPNIKIQEISRSVSDGTSNIQFAISVSMGDKDISSHQLKIIPKETNISPLILPIYCYRSETHQQESPFLTKQINLGVFARNETKMIQIYGNPDVIHVIKNITWKNIPSNIVSEILKQDSNRNDVLEVALKCTDSFPYGFFEGQICLKTLGGKEFVLPVNGEVVESVNIPITSRL